MANEDALRGMTESRARLVTTLEEALDKAHEAMRRNAELASNPEQRASALERMRATQLEIDRITRDLAKIRVGRDESLSATNPE